MYDSQREDDRHDENVEEQQQQTRTRPSSPPSSTSSQLQRRRCRRRIGKYALNDTVQTHSYDVNDTDVDVRQFIMDNAHDIICLLDDALSTLHSVKWYGTIAIAFDRTTSDGDVQHTTGRFRTHPTITYDIWDLDVEGMASQFLLAIENFNSRSSQWVVDHIIDFRVTLAHFQPAQGLSFLPTPREIL